MWESIPFSTRPSYHPVLTIAGKFGVALFASHRINEDIADGSFFCQQRTPLILLGGSS
jgi:hypothetical protein